MTSFAATAVVFWGANMIPSQVHQNLLVAESMSGAVVVDEVAWGWPLPYRTHATFQVKPNVIGAKGRSGGSSLLLR